MRFAYHARITGDNLCMFKPTMVLLLPVLCLALALCGCGGGSNVYNLPEDSSESLRIVLGNNPNEVICSSERKGKITMIVGETMNINTIYRFRSAFGEKEKDEYVTDKATYNWLEPVNDKLSLSNGTISALQPGLDTLKAAYHDPNAGVTIECKLEITVVAN